MVKTTHTNRNNTCLPTQKITIPTQKKKLATHCNGLTNVTKRKRARQNNAITNIAMLLIWTNQIIFTNTNAKNMLFFTISIF
jgi:hypothetical protein